MFQLILDGRVGVGQLKSFLGRKKSIRKDHKAKNAIGDENSADIEGNEKWPL